MLIPFNFEEIYSKESIQVVRAKVPGGWLVYSVVNSPRANTNVTSDFIIDADHTWEVKRDVPR